MEETFPKYFLSIDLKGMYYEVIEMTRNTVGAVVKYDDEFLNMRSSD